MKDNCPPDLSNTPADSGLKDLAQPAVSENVCQALSGTPRFLTTIPPVISLAVLEGEIALEENGGLITVNDCGGWPIYPIGFKCIPEAALNLLPYEEYDEIAVRQALASLDNKKERIFMKDRRKAFAYSMNRNGNGYAKRIVDLALHNALIEAASDDFDEYFEFDRQNVKFTYQSSCERHYLSILRGLYFDSLKGYFVDAKVYEECLAAM